jgi:hypothetical protein
MNINSGFFNVDITGYTMFLTQSELMHAKEILDTLFAAILRHIQPPLKVHRTQGDAIIAYTSEDAFLNPATLLDTIEDLYFDFHRQLDVMAYNTTCTCQACVNMRQLDLKLFLHFGEHLLKSIGDRTDLQESDVIHRLMKNTVKEKTGLTGYALLTEAAIQAMNAREAAERMIPHTEEYEHLGTVRVYIHDLQRAWIRNREQRRIIVSAEGAWVYAATEVPADQWIAWDYLLDVENKKRFSDMLNIVRTDPEGGRLTFGSSFHCHHGLHGEIDYTIIDWDPPNYFTIEVVAFGLRYLSTWRITPTEAGCHIEFIFAAPHEGDGEGMQQTFVEVAQAAADRYTQIIAEAIREGKIKRYESV